jgi:hypothetical protein
LLDLIGNFWYNAYMAKGYLHSKESKKKISRALKGLKRSTETRAKQSLYARNRTPEHKKKLASATSKRMKGRIPWNKGLTGIMDGKKNPMYGTKISPQQRRKMVAGMKRKYPRGVNYGKKHSPEVIKKIKAARARQTGDKHPNWKGGISRKYDRYKGTEEWIAWRKEVYERDDYTCRKCSYKSGLDKPWQKLEPHHIIGVSDLIKHKMVQHIFNPDNGVTFCYRCHRRITGKQNYSNLSVI